MRHDFASGAWAEFRPLSAFRGTDRRIFQDARYTGYVLDADGDYDGDATSAKLGAAARGDLYASNIRAVATALAVTSWSFPVPLPVIVSDGQHRTVTGAEALDTDLGLDDLLELESLLLPYQLALSRQPNPKAPAAATTTASSGLSPDAETTSPQD